MDSGGGLKLSRRFSPNFIEENKRVEFSGKLDCNSDKRKESGRIK